MLSKELQQGKAGEHLVCADLILRGYNAFLSDQGLPFDIVVEKEGAIWRVQVKTTKGPANYNHKAHYENGKLYSGRRFIYRFGLRRGKGGRQRATLGGVDVFAFVALDTRQIAYVRVEELINSNGQMKLLMEFTANDKSPNRGVSTWGKRMEQYQEFPEGRVDGAQGIPSLS